MGHQAGAAAALRRLRRMLPLVWAAAAAVAAGGRRDVMIWTDCAPETMCADPSPPPDP